MRFGQFLLVLSLLPLSVSTAEPPTGTSARTPWVSSRVIGSPEPPSPYQTVRVYEQLKLDRPLDMAPWPLGGRWIVSEESGLLHTFAKDKPEKTEPFLDIRRKSSRDPQAFEACRLWSFTFHPKFAENGYLYVCYADSKPQPSRTRISRYTVDLKSPNSPPQCNPDSEFIVLEWLAGEDHFGGCVKFGADGYLYCPVGDGSGYADGNNSGQDLSDFQASILRIDVDHQGKGRAYAIPKDNPFISLHGARPEIYAFGMRNIWRMSFDRATGDLWAGDVGQDLWDMVLRVEKGGNYGWSVTEGTHPFREERKVGPAPISPPVVEHDHSEARSITGGFVYRGTQRPELIGTYLYGDFDTGKIWGIAYNRSAKKVLQHRELVDTALRIVGFAEDQDGELLIIDYTGTLHQLVPRPPVDPAITQPEFPKLLSQTGLFANTQTHEPAPGVIPYSVNSPLWSDGAHKERFIAVPGNKQIEYHPTESWKFPEGSVLVKTFALDLEPGKAQSRRRLETRLLHIEQDHWRGYTYVWKDDQSDAELLDTRGADKTFVVKDANAPGGQRQQVWHFPSRSECTLCHTMPARFVLGVNTPQMNLVQSHGTQQVNQLDALDDIGVFTKKLSAYHGPKDSKTGVETSAPRERLVNPHDVAAPLTDRARSYLHVNCADCHIRWGGGNALFQLQYTLPLEATGTIQTLASHGDFGIPGAKILVPGDAEKSLLWHRMRITDRGRMPHVGSNVVDRQAVELIKTWINSLKTAP